MTQMTLTCSRSKIPTCMLCTPPLPSLRCKCLSLSLYDEPFLNYTAFSEKCTKWTQMTFTCSRSKIPTCMLQIPLRPKFLSVSLYDEPFSIYRPIFGKVHRMTPNHLDMFKVKNTKMHITHTPPTPKFTSVSLYNEPFLTYGPIYGKVHRMTPNDLDMFKDKNANMHATNTPRGPNFRPFALRWAVFELRPNFRKSALNDLKWPWLVPGQKYKHGCYIHPQGPNFQSVSLYVQPFLSCGLIFGENTRLV